MAQRVPRSCTPVMAGGRASARSWTGQAPWRRENACPPFCRPLYGFNNPINALFMLAWSDDRYVMCSRTGRRNRPIPAGPGAGMVTRCWRRRHNYSANGNLFGFGIVGARLTVAGGGQAFRSCPGPWAHWRSIPARGARVAGKAIGGVPEYLLQHVARVVSKQQIIDAMLARAPENAGRGRRHARHPWLRLDAEAGRARRHRFRHHGQPAT